MLLYSIYTLFSSHRRAPRLVAEARAEYVVLCARLARRGGEANVRALRAVKHWDGILRLVVAHDIARMRPAIGNVRQRE